MPPGLQLPGEVGMRACDFEIVHQLRRAVQIDGHHAQGCMSALRMATIPSVVRASMLKAKVESRPGRQKLAARLLTAISGIQP